MDCTPASLSQAAACLTCIPSGQRWGVIAYLMCQWAQTEAPVTCGTPSDFIIVTGAGDAAANQQYNFVNLVIGYQGLTDPTYTIKTDLNGDWWIYHNFTNLYKSAAADFPCVWTLDGGAGTGPAPTGVWGVAGPCGKPTNTIAISGAGDPGTNQNYALGIQPAYAAYPVFVGLTNNDYVIDPTLSPSFIFFQTTPGNWNAYYQSVLYPCTWIQAGGGPDPQPPTGQFV